MLALSRSLSGSPEEPGLLTSKLGRGFLRLSGERRKNETESENDREPHRHLKRDDWRGV